MFKTCLHVFLLQDESLTRCLLTEDENFLKMYYKRPKKEFFSCNNMTCKYFSIYLQVYKTFPILAASLDFFFQFNIFTVNLSEPQFRADLNWFFFHAVVVVNDPKVRHPITDRGKGEKMATESNLYVTSYFIFTFLNTTSAIYATKL